MDWSGSVLGTPKHFTRWTLIKASAPGPVCCVLPLGHVGNTLLSFNYSYGLLLNWLTIQHLLLHLTNSNCRKSQQSQKSILAPSHLSTAKALSINLKCFATVFSQVSPHCGKQSPQTSDFGWCIYILHNLKRIEAETVDRRLSLFSLSEPI